MFWTVRSNSVDRVSCSWDSGIFIINELCRPSPRSPFCKTYGLMGMPQTPNPIRIAFTRMADLAREIRIGCYGVDELVNGEVTGKEGLTVVVAGSNC